MSLQCVLCHDKRLIPVCRTQQPLRHQLPSFVTRRRNHTAVLIEMVDPRVHHSKQFFAEKIVRIDFFCPPSGGCLHRLCTPHGRSGRLKQQSLLDSRPREIWGTDLLFCICMPKKAKKKKFELTFMMSTINLHTSNSILSKQHYARSWDVININLL